MKKTRLFVLLALCILVTTGCFENGGQPDASPVQPLTAEENPVSTTQPQVVPQEEPPPPPPEGRPVFVYKNGHRHETTEPQAKIDGLAIIDLSNYWVPFIFSEQDQPDGPRLVNHFRPIYRKLANDWPYESRCTEAARKIVEKRKARAKAAKIQELREQGVSEAEIAKLYGTEPEKNEKPSSKTDKENTDNEADTDPNNEEKASEESGAGESDHYLEVYGIHPSLSVLRKRAIEEVDRPCFADVDMEAIRRYDGYVAYKSNEAAKANARKGRTFSKKMRAEMEKLGLSDPFELIKHPNSKVSKGLANIAMRYEALVEVQKQLICEGLFSDTHKDNHRTGGLDWKTHLALTAFERKNRVFAWGVMGKETLEMLKKPPKERLFEAFSRVIAERVIDSMGIIEDGSVKKVDGKQPTYKDENGVEHPVPNLVAEYTATILRHMDLASPDKVLAFLKGHDDKFFDTLFVAIPLPKLPPYYSNEMQLHSVINRGDVWYDYPYTPDGKKKGQPRKRMPQNTLYVKWNGQDIPLVNMNTTIGSWRTELAPDGYEYYKYKNSDVGPRVWKDIVAAPVWMPPDTAPAADLIKSVRYKGRTIKVPNYDEFGPWYASAYGLVAAFHYRQIEKKNGTFKYLDNGIRSHGSVDYNSILRRYSHGCHRLYNHLAIRLFNFVLQHKKFKRVGQVPAGYAKRVEIKEPADEGETESPPEVFNISLDSRGYKYELENPVPVEVVRGRIRGKQRSPLTTYMPKPGFDYPEDAQFIPEEFKVKPAAAGVDAGVR